MAETESSLTVLGQEIHKCIHEFKSQLVAHDFPEPSFDSALSQAFLTIGDHHFQAARIALIEKCRDLLDSVLGPHEFFKYGVPISIQFNSALSAVVHFGLAYHVPQKQGTTVSFQALAQSCNLHIDRVTRILRCVVAHHVFREDPIGFISHNAASKVLTEPGPNAWLGHQLEEMMPAAAKLTESFSMYPDVDSDRETAFSVAFSEDQRKTYWEVLERQPCKVQRFSDALEYVCSSEGPGDFRPLVAAYDWRKLGSSTLVDVGGSSGRVACAIAQHASPDMSFVIQDLPEVEAAASSQIKATKLEHRARFRAHDFFSVQPERDARAYLLRQILHDWPDQMAIEILRALVPALNDGDYILLMEAVLPPAAVWSNHVERLIRSADLLMMAKHNSKERTLAMWHDLVKQADMRFQIENVVTSDRTGAVDSIIEIRWHECHE